VLRFEQRIENGTGTVVISLPISLELQGMLSKMEKGYLRENAATGERGHWKLNGKAWDCIKKEYFATVDCIKCKGKMETSL
jgi:hypothetical protein